MKTCGIVSACIYVGGKPEEKDDRTALTTFLPMDVPLTYFRVPIPKLIAREDEMACKKMYLDENVGTNIVS